MKKNFLKIFVFFITLFLAPKVFAAEFNMNNYTSATLNGTTKKYRSTEIYNTGQSSIYNFGTKYNGRISDIETYFNYPFSANTTYTLTYNMNTEDFRNNFGSSYWWYCDSGEMTNANAIVVMPSFVSMKKVKLTFTTGDNASTCIRVWLRSSNLSSTAITGVSNWQLNNITIYDPDWQNGTTSSSGSQGTTQGSTTGTSSTNDNSDIINSANENTQDIIDNAQQNTQDIIDNQNQNTQDIINGIDSVNQQLGTCIKNLLNNIYKVNSFLNMYIGDDKIAHQIEPDSSNSPRLKLQLYNLSTLVSESDYKPTIAVGRFNFPFTYNTNITRIVFGVNGQTKDTLLQIPLEVLDLEDGATYTLSFSVVNATQGSIAFNNFSLVKGNYISNVVLPYGESVCTSKLDNFIATSEQNKDEIISNQNQNTQDIIDSTKVCKTTLIDKSYVVSDGYLNANGTIHSSSTYGVSSFIPITSNDTLTILNPYYGSSDYVCFYNSSKTNISCVNIGNSLTGNLTIPSNASYFRADFNTSTNVPTFNLKSCTDGNQAINDSINDTNNYLKDDSDPNIADSEFTNLFNTVGFTDPLSYLLQLPVQFINQLVSQSNVCQTISLGTLWGVSISLPCINIGSIIGEQVWDTIDVLFSVGLLVVIFKNLYQTFANLMTMGGEKEAREKFSMPTPMEFLSLILGGDR